MNFYVECRFIIMRDYLGDLVIYIVPYRRLYGSRILCVRDYCMHSLLCWYCMRLGRFYYVILTFHVLSLYIMFLSHLLFLCVAVYLSPLLSSLTISSLFFFSNCNFNYERERERSKYMSNDLVPSNRVSSSFAHTRTPSTRRTAGSSLQMA